jgi:hypothetical protein
MDLDRSCVDADCMTSKDEASGSGGGSREFEAEVACSDSAGQDQAVHISVADSVRMVMRFPVTDLASFTWRQALVLNQQVTAAISVIVSSAMNEG